MGRCDRGTAAAGSDQTLYDLDSGIPDVIGLRALQPETMMQGGNGITMRRSRMIGLLRSRSPGEGALLARSCFLSRSCRMCMGTWR